MKKIAAIAITAAALFGATSALAFEKSGTTEIETEKGTVIATFEAAFDPQTGAFTRTGDVKLANGRQLDYSLAGTCEVAARTCEFSGTVQGPYRGKWAIEGEARRDGATVFLNAEVLAPYGETITIHREMSGDMPLLKDLPALGAE